MGTDEGMTDGEEGGREWWGQMEGGCGVRPRQCSSSYVHVVLVVSSWCGLVVVPSFCVRASLLHVVVAYIVCRVVVMVVVVSLWCRVVVWWCGGGVHGVNDDDKRQPRSSFVVSSPRHRQWGRGTWFGRPWDGGGGVVAWWWYGVVWSSCSLVVVLTFVV